MTTKTELKPCPFCGKEAIIDGSDLFGYFVRCTSCSIAQDKLFGQKCDAKRRWNTRNGEQKIGKWIIHTEIENVYGAIFIECSECGERYSVQNLDDEKFCRACGARMVGD